MSLCNYEKCELVNNLKLLLRITYRYISVLHLSSKTISYGKLSTEFQKKINN